VLGEVEEVKPRQPVVTDRSTRLSLDGAGSATRRDRPPTIRDVARERVHRAIQELGYRPTLHQTEELAPLTLVERRTA
jgi:hypothetical protein